MTFKQRLEVAVKKDGSILVPLSALKAEEGFTHSGFAKEYLISLGLTKVDLKKLKRKNCAIEAQSRWLLLVDDGHMSSDLVTEPLENVIKNGA